MSEQTRKVFDLYREGKTFDYVVTVCPESQEGECPAFPGVTHRLHLPFLDPDAVQGSYGEKLSQVRAIRDSIRARMAELITWVRSDGTWKLGEDWEVTKV